jgi:RNA polymerase sigma-70 factor (ECF subfamily)
LWADGQLLHEFIGRLPNDQQEVIQMAYFHGLTHSEIADSTGLPLGTVKSRLRLGLQKLRSIWEKEAVGM